MVQTVWGCPLPSQSSKLEILGVHDSGRSGAIHNVEERKKATTMAEKKPRKEKSQTFAEVE